MAKGKNKKKSRTYISSIDFNNFKSFKGKKKEK